MGSAASLPDTANVSMSRSYKKKTKERRLLVGSHVSLTFRPLDRSGGAPAGSPGAAVFDVQGFRMTDCVCTCARAHVGRAF